MAHYGVLFLDEIAEFDRKTLEALRQPLEDGRITISRLHGTITYPARTTLILACNPCPCGNASDPTKICTCTPRQIREYFSKISGPLLDRIDMFIDVAPVKYEELEATRAVEKSGDIRERVVKARNIQLKRYKGFQIYSNSQLQPAMIERFCKLNEECRALLRKAFDKLGLTARSYNRVLKVARTIADLEEKENIELNHLAEALQYRIKYGTIQQLTK